MTGVTVTVRAGHGGLGPAARGLGTVEIELAERGKGPDAPIPGKVVVQGPNGDPDPQFATRRRRVRIASDVRDRDRERDRSAARSRKATRRTSPADATTRAAAARALRGLRARAASSTASTAQDGTREARARRKRLKFTLDAASSRPPDAISADFHIHSGRSLDTPAGLRDRVAAFAGEGVEVMVSTDHDYHLDYAPVIAGARARRSRELDRRQSRSPARCRTRRPSRTRSATSTRGRCRRADARSATARSRTSSSRRTGSSRGCAPRAPTVIQYNHVRAGVSGLTSIGFFNNIGYEPDLPITAPAERRAPRPTT